MMSAIMICCGFEQWTSRDKMSGYGDEKKAYLAMATTASSKRTREVSVCPCCMEVYIHQTDAKLEPNELIKQEYVHKRSDSLAYRPSSPLVHKRKAQ
jgi:hypothetical protein